MEKTYKYVIEKARQIKIIRWCYFNVTKLKTRHKWGKIIQSDEVRIELGSGPKKGSNGWITVDLYGADISWDLRNGIPLPDNCVDHLYTSHMLEHIPYKNLIAFLSECNRILKPGGSLSVCVPNAAFYIKAYVQNKEFRKNDYFDPARVDTGSFIDQVNYIAYMGGQHNYMFDEQNLVNTIKKANFKIVLIREFDINIDIESRRFESIYAKAIK